MRDSYDEISYPSMPRAQTHPDHLATIATLYGMTPAPVDGCRVLELGCGDGSNLIPMAFDNPHSTFIGIDRAETPIKAACAFVSKLGLRNIEFHQLDLCEWEPVAGEFDYIIAHGLYSWVPPAVQERILTICGSGLSPEGIAYISYNVLPGCHFRRYVWDLLKFHTAGVRNGREKIEQATALARLMIDQLKDSPQHLALKKEFETVLERSGEATFHDDLGQFNTPLYLTEFAQAAEAHGLQYLSDTDLQRDDIGGLPLNAEGWLQARQYGDYLASRRFRETLLCRQEVKLDRVIGIERLKPLHIACRATTEPEQANGEQKFNLAARRVLTTNGPHVKQLLCQLSEKWPASFPLSELPIIDQAGSETVDLLKRLFQMEAIELRFRPVEMACSVSEFPVSSPLARAQLSGGCSSVTNLLHMSVELTDSISRAMLLLLDGSRNREALLRDLKSAVEPGVAGPSIEGGRPLNRAEIDGLIDKSLDTSLNLMARVCLLKQ